jgi:RNA polymerase primary sigma factor
VSKEKAVELRAIDFFQSPAVGTIPMKGKSQGGVAVKDFTYQALKELADQQVRYAPPERRLEQLSRTEQLLSEIDPDKTYPYPFICYRITDFRPAEYADLLMIGSDVVHDLGLFVSELAQSMPALPVENVAEPVLTLEEFSKKLNVTTKTINRWRKRGLIGLPILFNGRRHVGFLPSLVDPFLLANKIRVEKGGKFSQLSTGEKEGA